MQHCFGGPGPDDFGQVGNWHFTDPQHSVRVALENWVEHGQAPSSMVTTKFAGDSGTETRTTMTRPLCPYPEVANYNGSGDTKEMRSFVCAAHE
jgi:feruloyl esterase